MAITLFQKLSSSPHVLRYRIAGDSAVQTITNARILSDATPGPLRGLYTVSGLLLAQAQVRCLEAAQAKLSCFATIGIPAFSMNISVDGSGRPQVDVAFAVGGGANEGVFDIEFRHTFLR